jgi:hypothetical protein
MRSTFILASIMAALLWAGSVRADDTSDFVNPDNWEGLMQYWKIDNGVITGTSPGEGLKSNTFLCSKKNYRDFELKFQVRAKGGPDYNSGIQIRSQLFDIKTFEVAGPQCDIGEGYWACLYGERLGKDGKVGGGHMMKAADREAVNKVLKKDEFNDYYIKCVGKRVTIKLNDLTMVDEDFDIMTEAGIIAWQLHVTKTPMEVIFKDITFKEVK